ncbi:MAG TPA: BamA/TamA family outer membrane protein [Candidatus Paenalcaligenes intestinipullorum]|uniref:Translocation and assembly module subunit TamA n=1 Tax=Candidatus Paenalcaligenes intestinipullorum TaxID=2838718 RepID=A0A9D2RGS9_9BURK|nr:BamA/TamA family outer membrane protein [Candidatus Paenalcaligenes intestinipullorum]
MPVRRAGLLFSLCFSQVVWAASSTPEVIIDPGGVAPAALSSIYEAVDAITRLAEDQDLTEVSRLQRRAHDATLSALQTQGYYDAVVTLEVGELEDGQETWDIIIEPGIRTTVQKVMLDFSGQITQPEFELRVQDMRDRWLLNEDDVFLNSEWSKAKQELLIDVKSHAFYFARYDKTQAVVHAEEGKADLDVRVRSGPRVRLGKLFTSGLNRVPDSLITRYVRYEEGQVYDQAQLDDWQQALQSTSFFRGAFVTLDTESPYQEVREDGEVELPVSVRVTEAPAQRLSASLGVDSDHGPNIETVYRQNVIFNQPWWSESGLGLNKHRQRVFSDLYFPPTYGGYQSSVGVLYDREDINGVMNRRLGLGWKLKRDLRSKTGVEYNNEWGVLAAWDKTKIVGQDPYRIPSVIGTWNILRRDVNDIYDPRDGNLVNLGLGVGVNLDDKKPFYRASLRGQQWWSIGKQDVLTVRAEVGKVWSKATQVPTDFGYRTGGARSVRGYGYDKIGIRQGDAIIGAPTLAVASVEYIHYITSMYGVSAFVDVGDAAESFSAMKPYVGYGVGASVRTPAGPIYVDLAYGQTDKRLRLHFSLGIAF